MNMIGEIKLKLKDEVYREITGKAWFDINAGQKINFTMTFQELWSCAKSIDINEYIPSQK